MSYILSTDRKKLEAYQAEVDVKAGYPESLESLRHVGPGIHAPKEVGRALHYATIDTNAKGDTFALPVHEAKTAPVDAKVTVVEKLPDDWKPLEALVESHVVSEKG